MNGWTTVLTAFLVLTSVAVPPARGQTAPLLQTGQMTSFTSFGFDDGYYRKGRSFSYTDHLDGTVTDNVTGLMWCKDALGPGWGYGTELTWEEALVWVESLDFAGHDDWRLPNVRELGSLLNLWRYPRTNPVFINVDNYIWTSTSYHVDPVSA